MNEDILQIGIYKATLIPSYVYRDGMLYTKVAIGEHIHSSKATRNAGKYKIYVNSFPRCAQPYSTYYIANTENGKVYRYEALHYLTGTLNEFVNILKEM